MIRTNIHLISFIKKKCVAKQWAKIRKKFRHSVCLRAFFLFEVYYCPMLFLKINVRKHSLFGILHSRKNRNIEPERALKSLKMGLKREIRTFWSVFFIFRPASVILIKR